MPINRSEAFNYYVESPLYFSDVTLTTFNTLTTFFHPVSESSVTATFGDLIDLTTHQRVMDCCAFLLERPFPGQLSVVPAYTSVTVFFNPGQAGLSARVVCDLLNEQLFDVPSRERLHQPVVDIPVRYGGEYGPDLPEVADRLQLSEKEVIRLHSETVYTVFMIGFLPGFPYLGLLTRALELPRRDTPRLRVPAGSVAIAGQQTGIYPQASPGGWHLIGRTDVRLFDASQQPPALLQPGMKVRFVDLGN